jgi:subtilase family serine protease
MASELYFIQAMRVLTSILFLVSLITLCTRVMSLDSADHWRVMESSDEHGSPFMKQQRALDFVKKERVSADEVITLTFVIKQNDIEDLALSIADPASPNYGKHLKRDEIEALTRNIDGENVVKAYMDKYHIKAGERSLKSYISGEAPARVWEEAIHTEFYHYLNTKSGETIIRTDRYSLPESVAQHVHSVLNTVQFPSTIHGGPRIQPVVPHGAEA